MTPRARILACGSIDGGDDAAGLAVLDLLPAGIRSRASVEEVRQLSAEQLLDDPPGTMRIVVDCVRGVEPGRVVDLPLADVPAMERRLGTASTHALSVGQAVALAAALGGVHERDRFVGIGGARYAPGAPLSGQVAAGLPELAGRIGLAMTGSED